MAPTPHKDKPTTYEGIKKKCLAEGSLFEDPDFPATFRSLFLETVQKDLAWKRPKELKDTAVFMREATYRDLYQGKLGDCWLISAINCLLTNNRKVFDKIVPSNQSFTEDYAGIFRFNFWWYGEWKEVVVDDRLPVDTNTQQLLYAHNNSEPDEFWVCLLEKAYAKLVGCYENLTGASTSFGTVQMTGGVSEYILFENDDPAEIFELLSRMQDMNSMFSCAILGAGETTEGETKEGLFTIHAYCLIKLMKVQYQGKEVGLVKLRNPWGKKEWNGPWSDSSEEWNGLKEEERKRMNLEVKDDGEFWMDINDVVKHFSFVDMCHMDPFAITSFEETAEKPSARKWHTFRADGQWLKKITSGGSDNSKDIYWKNPQYLLEIRECGADVQTVISLMHRFFRQDLKVGTHLYKLNPGYPTPLPEKFDEYATKMETKMKEEKLQDSTFGIFLAPGSYVIVPYNVSNESAEFVLRVFTDVAVTTRSLDDMEAVDPEPVDEIAKITENLLASIFEKNTPSSKVDAHQLRRVLNTVWRIDKLARGEIFSLETCRCLIERYNKSRDGLLTLDDTKECWDFLNMCQRHFRVCDLDESGAVDIHELLPYYDISQTYLKHSGGEVAFNSWFPYTMNPREPTQMAPTPHKDKPTTYEGIKKKCLAEGSLFEDLDFPATFRSLFLKTVQKDLVWKRPKELKKTAVFMREATYRDFNQGALGDCWFISAVNVLVANNRKVFENVVPGNQSFTEDYAGIFRFNFWWYGEWKEVVVDDRLPVDRITHKILYAHNNSEPDEFWVCLLEKAYAKLAGSYETLIGGFVTRGLVDMTGGVSECFLVNADDTNPTETFQMMTRMSTMQSMFSCGIVDKDYETEGKTSAGLFAFHAYGIIKLMKVQYQGKEVGLVKLRNPWGKKEWNGPWSDSSEEWNGLKEEERKRMNLEVKDDGEFWMDFNDFIKNFSLVEMCHIDPFAITSFQETAEKPSARKWHTFRADGQWLKKITSGGSDNSKDIYWKNPQYLLEIRECGADVRTVISLMHRPSHQDISIGVHLYKLNPGYPTPLPERFDEYATKMERKLKSYVGRETTFGIVLVPGSYVMVPFCEDDTSTEFILRVFTETAVTIRSLDDMEAVDPEPVDEIAKITENLLASIFERNTPSSKVDARQLRRVLNTMWRIDKETTADIFSLETCRCLIERYNKSRDGLLTLDDTKECWDFLNMSQRHFRFCDLDDSGAVDIHELLPYYDLTHGKLNKCVAVNICIRYADQNGRMFFDDFCQSVTRLRTLTKVYLKHASDDVTFTSWFPYTMNPRST
ncbi:calpain-2 catalytic subunit-like [Octopus vulgaris]|uniref:Calpain-2 catalytic subunit-like n=1 Tax=Octopus vulgaris TaxID=6645 RepID=A0AA36FM95_OCTVU|nr:calpain-2 catalytic subunit-like [Octopus vulgaris]